MNIQVMLCDAFQVLRHLQRPVCCVLCIIYAGVCHQLMRGGQASAGGLHLDQLAHAQQPREGTYKPGGQLLACAHLTTTSVGQGLLP